MKHRITLRVMVYATLVVLLGVFGLGCASPKIVMLNTVDFNRKTVCMESGGYGLTGALKSALRKDGWKVYVLNKGKEVTIGRTESHGDVSDLWSESEFQYKASYRISLHYDGHSESCIRYEIILIDNESGEEVIIMSDDGGVWRAKNEDIAEAFINAMHYRISE